MLQQAKSNIPTKELTSRISSKGQITLPVEVRRYLRVKISDKIAFSIAKTGEVTVSQARYPDILSLKGAAGSLSQSLEWGEVKKIAHEDRSKNRYEK